MYYANSRSFKEFLQKESNPAGLGSIEPEIVLKKKSRSKIHVKLLIFGVIVLAVLSGLLKLHSQNLLSLSGVAGFVPLENSEYAKYYETLITKYEPEPRWHPNERFGTSFQPDIVAESAMLADLNTGKILYEKNASVAREIASLTKIMTAVVALEHSALNQNFTVSQKAAGIGENSMGLTAGEKYSLEELLYGLILVSGNDAAYAIAENVAGDSDTFVSWMNLKAQELGMQDTYFADPSGLDDSTRSTALDLIKLTRYALKDPDFKRISASLEKELVSDSHKYIYLYNQTNLLSTYPGVAGIKTGYTEEAGLCLVTYANNDGEEVVGVVLDSIDRKGDMILMLDHGFSTLGVLVEHNLL